LESIVFTVPPHQQRFVIGDSITEDQLTVKVRPLYTQWDKKKHQHVSRVPTKTISLPIAGGRVFELKSRVLKVQNYANPVRETLKELGSVECVSSSWEANDSALMALHLSETIPELVIRVPKTPKDTPKLADDRLFGRLPFQFLLPKAS
jgi:hypothetical protein